MSNGKQYDFHEIESAASILLDKAFVDRKKIKTKLMTQKRIYKGKKDDATR